MGLFIECGIVEIFYLFLLSFWLIYLYFVKFYGYWEERNVPQVPPVFPLGSAVEGFLGKVSWEIALDKIYCDFKDERYVGLFLLRNPWLMVRDPELIKLILQKDFSSFTDRSSKQAHADDYMFHNIFNLNGQAWKERRLKLMPAYTAAKMSMMFFLVKKCSDILRNFIEENTAPNNVIDVKEILSRYTTSVIGNCAFGVEIDALYNKDSQLYKMGRMAMNFDFKVLFKMYVSYIFPIFSILHCFDLYDPKIKNFVINLVQSTLKQREQSDVNRCDFLDILTKLEKNQRLLRNGYSTYKEDLTTDNKNKGLTIEQITSETFMFFTAGLEITSNTMLFCLYELACNKKIQERLHQEVLIVLSKHDNIISYQALQDMTYLDQVINETMRRYPPFPFLTRVCTKKYKLPDSTLEIDEGLSLLIPIYSIHHDPNYFPDPFKFDPERFDAQHSTNRHSFVYLPFGEGPRMCIGIHFGLMKVKTAVATLVLDYEISPTPDTEMPLQLKANACVTQPAKTLHLAFTKRNA
ncbi:probable cytochrome P450 6a13 [Homalodisca vitripennis]|uniref:probable cytochrome P450 6a13 n=1 Tax=Homalodisca vitripennis TaxID=197043 RepID=UPI001EEA664F|nr:probable cytochrome P450 6a13 [Homalodisca vitripennis]